MSHFWVVAWSSAFFSTVLRPVSNCTQTGTNPLYNVTAMRCSFVEVGRTRRGPILFVPDRRTSGRGWTAGIPRASCAMRLQRTCRRSMRTATAALVTTMSRPSSLAGGHRVSLPISSQGAAKDCALSLTWSGRAAENPVLLKRQHRSRSRRRFPEDALVANVGCRRRAAGQNPEPRKAGFALGGSLAERLHRPARKISRHSSMPTSCG